MDQTPEDAFSISISDLREAFSRVLDEVERTRGGAFDLDGDYYWLIHSSAAFDLSEEPTPMTGQLSDDVASLREFLGREHGEPVIVWHDLEHIVGILRRLVSLDMP